MTKIILKLMKDGVDMYYNYENTASQTYMYRFLIDNSNKVITLKYFQEFLGYIEKLYLQRAIFNLIHQVNEDELNSSISEKSYKPELHESYHLYFTENEYLYNIYMNLVDIYNKFYPSEVEIFNAKREKHLQSYNGMIELESENFEPYEHLHFHNSNCYKQYYENNKRILDNILINIKDFNINDFNIIFDEYNNIFEEVSHIIKKNNYQNYKIIITI